MSRAGPRVIGEEEWRRRQAQLAEADSQSSIAIGPPTAGPRVLGEEEYNRRMKAYRQQFEDEPEAPEPEEPEQGFVLSVEELKATLERNPSFIEDMIVAELNRPTGPRPEALLVIRDAEKKRSRPRGKILAQLDEILEPG